VRNFVENFFALFTLIFGTQLSWINAKRMCIEKGMKLVSIESVEEDSAIVQAIQNGKKLFIQRPKQHETIEKYLFYSQLRSKFMAICSRVESTENVHFLLAVFTLSHELAVAWKSKKSLFLGIQPQLYTDMGNRFHPKFFIHFFYLYELYLDQFSL
jgi:hypothetical protein